MSDEPFECYNHIIWYIMQWVERGTVKRERFFTGLFGERSYGILLGMLSYISLKTSEDQAAFSQEAKASTPPLVHGQPLSSQAMWWCP